MSANRNNFPPKMEECLCNDFKTIKNNGQIGHMTNACMFISVAQACRLFSQSRPYKTLLKTVIDLRIQSRFPNKSIQMEIGGKIGGQSVPHDACMQKVANITNMVIDIYCANKGDGENRWIGHSPSLSFFPQNSQPVARIAIVSMGYHYELIVSATATTKAVNISGTDFKVKEFFAGSPLNRQDAKRGDKSGEKPIVVKVNPDSKQDGKAGAIPIVPPVNNKDGKAGAVPNAKTPVQEQQLDQQKESKEEYKRLLAGYRAKKIDTEGELKLVLAFVSDSRSELRNATKKAHDDAIKYLTNTVLLDTVMAKNTKILEAIQAGIENGEAVELALNEKLAWLREMLPDMV